MVPRPRTGARSLLAVLLTASGLPTANGLLRGSTGGVNPKICLRHVPTKYGFGTCKYISRHWCSGAHETVANLTGGFAACLAPKRSCALVGSSRHLLNASFGPEIDGHDEVVRLNNAPAGGPSRPEYAAHVGARTTARFQGHFPEALPEEMNNGMCIFLHTPHSLPYRLDHMLCGSDRQKRDFDGGHNYIFMDLAHAEIAARLQSTATAGIVALTHLLHTCKEVTVYGFGPSCEGVQGQRYYNDNAVNSRHNYRREFGLLSRASAAGDPSRVFFHGDRSAAGWVRTRRLTQRVPECLQGTDGPDGAAAPRNLSSTAAVSGE